MRIARADLDTRPWPDLGRPDLVWASASMHHMADPGLALRSVRELLAPGGLFAVVELAGLPASCPPTPRRTGPASKSVPIPRPTASTRSTFRTAAPTGARC
ncbi:hypothetical protein SHKM778_39310 [Streptomyces sp. KM77-8]|uniref:Methyltransferase type 11 domain-containing protein n=1 Tax=Streptomyces haneummycinicus TaxID=3074435 RepID=A0AAT9HJQ9_9ACTN